MFRRRLMTCLLTLGCAIAAAPALANAQQSPLGQAEALYEQGQYDKAYKQYQKLAKDGNTFAQYRMSYMTLVGLGTRPDVVESLAWAVLAAEGDHAELDHYQSAVAAMVPGKERKKAEKKADYFLRRWGREDKGGGGQLALNSEGVCTGSRLASNCGQDGSGYGYWITWGPDRSSDPEQRQRIEELNRAIVAGASDLAGSASGS